MCVLFGEGERGSGKELYYMGHEMALGRFILLVRPKEAKMLV